MKTLIQTLATATLLAAITNCSVRAPDLTAAPRPAAPPPAAAPKLPDPRDFMEVLKATHSESTFTQEKFKNNVVTMNFRVDSADGKSVGKLTEKDFQIHEGSIGISKFQIRADEKKSYQVVDIVFAVDITGSMGPFIADAKVRLKEFIRRTYPEYHIRMCLTTFGDFVVKPCTTFYDNREKAQVNKFNSELSSLSIKKGQGEYPGELDKPENPLRSLLESTKVNWSPESQRFVIVVTDEDFYSPEKPGPKFELHQKRDDTRAPSLKEVNDAVKAKAIKVFAITPSATGYNSALNGESSITESSQGEWFDFESVLKKRVPLDSIFDKILQLVNTSYKLSYIVEENQGIPTDLPIEKRDVKVMTTKGKVQQDKPQSSQPKGRPEYKKQWTLSDKEVHAETARASINGKEGAGFSIQGGDVIFNEAPEAGSEIKVVYWHKNLRHNIEQKLLVFPAIMNEGNTKVTLNGVPARSGDIIYTDALNGKTHLELGEGVWDTQDYYKIRTNNSIKLQINHQP